MSIKKVRKELYKAIANRDYVKNPLKDLKYGHELYCDVAPFEKYGNHTIYPYVFLKRYSYEEGDYTIYVGNTLTDIARQVIKGYIKIF